MERVSISHKDAEPIVCTFETGSGAAVQGTLQSPCVYPMDADATANLITAVSNFRLGARLTAATDETRAQYGLNTPATVIKITQRAGLHTEIVDSGALVSSPIEACEITLILGEAAGDFFRYCEYEGTCYRVSGFLVNAFLKADAMRYLSTHPGDMGAGDIGSIVLQTGGGTLDIRAAYTENVLPNNELETDEYGNIVYTTTVTINGSPVSAKAFDAFTVRLAQLSISGTLDTVTVPEGTPRWQMTITTALGKTRTLAAYPMDSFHDILAVNGTAIHYISNEALEIALGDFAALPDPTANP